MIVEVDLLISLAGISGEETTLDTSEDCVDKTTLETSEDYVDKTTLETSEEDLHVDKTTLETSRVSFFRDAGIVWSDRICLKDSDNDGFSNGN